jgi:phosphatidylglycerophosphatase C
VGLITMTDANPVVVFDFDLTLTRWDTADRFFRWLLKRDAWRLALVALAFPVLGPLLLSASSRKWPVRFAVWVATWGRDPEALSALVDEHLRSLPEGPASVFLPLGVARLQGHLAQGHRVVIATGCLEPLARALLAHAGLGHVPLVASTLRPLLGGMVRDEHCFGPNKVPMLTARGFAPPWAVAYTDHHADLPVLERSAERFLIDPKPACRDRIERALPAGTSLLSWR